VTHLERDNRRCRLAHGIHNPETASGCKAGCKLELLLRPDDILHDDQSALHAKVVAKAFRGAEFLYTLELASGTRVLCLAPSHHDHALGEQLGIRVEVDHLVMFPQPGQAASAASS
jgi:iron(III) transport system ATP-binding protein